MSGLAERLATLRARHGRAVSLVGWSLGGIYARELARRRPDDVRQVITLASPFRVYSDGPVNPFFAGAPVKRTTPGGVGSTYLKDGAIHVVKKDGGEFVGACEAGEQFYATTCNSKLVGARYYAEGFIANVPADLRGEHEFISPRDGDGHGSHTSSTAVGNQISGMNVSGRQFGPSSGMAPAAKLATSIAPS